MEQLRKLFLANGAIRAGPVRTERAMAYATERMRGRRLPFIPTHAIVAVFAGKPDIGAGGGDYSENGARLRSACETLRELYPSNFYPSGNAYPLPAVQAARLAGLGWIGLNGLLNVPGVGSSVTIGAVLTDLELPDAGEGGYCNRCGLCAASCPAGAITVGESSRRFTRELCLSHRRQKEGFPLSRDGYYGCDICQDICPHAAG
ncbi:MAG: hypothetical protein LBR72_00350 [Oscillospiraceae bacterium]|nr:hypothetical protein [Oscillospiraceae bacterium]